METRRINPKAGSVEVCYRWPQDGRIEVRYVRDFGTPDGDRIIEEVRKLHREAIVGGWESPYFWRTFDEEGKERRHRVSGIAECPECGKSVDLEDDTEAWTDEAGEWVHEDYGPSAGVCCSSLIVDSFDGAEVYHLPEQA